MKNASNFIKEKGYPTHTPVTRVIENGEVSTFKQAFVGWRDKGDLGAAGILHPRGKKPKSMYDNSFWKLWFLVFNILKLL